MITHLATWRGNKATVPWGGFMSVNPVLDVAWDPLPDFNPSWILGSSLSRMHWPEFTLGVFRYNTPFPILPSSTIELQELCKHKKSFPLEIYSFVNEA